MPESHEDPFGTAELRRRVLAAWADSPARFRADANAEEDYALGGYRDRAVVELAQNAADAARRAGTRGRLRLALRGDEFTAANTGAPLTPAGVESLSTLRASAKRDGADDGAGPDSAAPSVGRFGTGFSSVAALSDDIIVASRHGAVRWNRELARHTLRTELPAETHPETAAEVERRAGRLPLLRLPFPGEEAPPAGYETAVTAALRDGEARAAVARMLTATSPALLLALPDLAEVEIDLDGEVRTLSAEEPPEQTGDVHTFATGSAPVRWRVMRRFGRFSPEALRDRPTEERERLDWSLTWAIPVDEKGTARGLPEGIPRVVHAPTPSDTPLTVPALLIGSFPLSSDRRHVAPGPATDLLLAEAADAYGELLTHMGTAAVLDLVPPRLASGDAADARLHAELAHRLPDVPFLRTALGGPVRPRDAVLVEGGGEVVDALTGLVPTALPGDTDPRHPALSSLEVGRLRLADLADMLAGREAEPEWWAQLYAALRAAGQRGADLTELGALPVPLADGRQVRGPRGLLLPRGEVFSPGGLSPESLTPIGLRIVHPVAADPLLEHLGAVAANERAVLTDPRTRAAVENSLDADDPDAVAEPVLDLVSATGLTLTEAPWLAELTLRDTEDVYCPAGELLLPDSPLREIFTEDAPFGVVADDIVERYDTATLQAVGVLHGFLPLRATDVTLVPGGEEGLAELALDRAEDWAAMVLERLGDPELPPSVPEFLGVRDLEFVRTDRWDRALSLLSARGPRTAVTEPARVVTGDGRSVDVPSYTAWWLGRNARIDGRRPLDLRLPAAPELADLYDPAPEHLDPGIAAALGVRGSLAALLADPDGPDDLLERLGDAKRTVPRAALHRIWRALAALEPDRVTPPAQVRAVLAADTEGAEHEDATVVADADATVVVDAPDLLPLLAGRPVLLVPPGDASALADVLDLPLAGEEVTGAVTSTGEPRPVPEVAGWFLDLEEHDSYLHHDALTVDGVPVPWRWVEGRIHADGVEGLARALAWASGAWERRHVLTAALRAPRSAARLLDEAALDTGR